MKNVLLHICLSLLAISPSALEANESKVDSLIQIANKAGKKEKLELLDKYTINYPTNLDVIGMLEKEAIVQSNYLYLASAYKSKVYYYTRVGNLDSTRLYLNLTDKALSLFDSDSSNKTNEEEKKRYDNIFKMLYTTRTALYLHEG